MFAGILEVLRTLPPGSLEAANAVNPCYAAWKSGPEGLLPVERVSTGLMELPEEDTAVAEMERQTELQIGSETLLRLQDTLLAHAQALVVDAPVVEAPVVARGAAIRCFPYTHLYLH